MSRNSAAYKRDVARRKALRKRRIAKEVYYDGNTHPYYSNLHQYSKNKIHCSCPLCKSKAYYGKHLFTRQEVHALLKLQEAENALADKNADMVESADTLR